MHKLPLLVLSLLVLAGLIAATPVLAGDAPPAAPVLFDAPPLCPADSSPAPAVGAPAPQPVLVFKCGVCSEVLCLGKNVGNRCGAGPDFEGFRCTNPSLCTEDGFYTCICELV